MAYTAAKGAQNKKPDSPAQCGILSAAHGDLKTGRIDRVQVVKVRHQHIFSLGEQSLRRPPLRGQRLSVRHREVLIRWHLTASLVGGLSFSWTVGRCPSPARKAGCWRGLGTRSAAATLDACRALLADHLSYGDRWGNPPAGA
ncbi:unnamed protein product [Pleuronectes platessa]|uniref:Uncharacterized protein n=1 Tax=Pleuronectes platessa TaxID=8262 RepID=A0A9N7U681_PLEPL|nr:unnamed protein product [Pleuronectes platessa]